MSHSRGQCNGRYYFSNGDFTEGFEFRSEQDEESGWFELKEFFPVVYKAVKSGEFFSFSLKNRFGGDYYFTAEECSLIVGHYVNEVIGHIDGLSVEDKLKLFKTPKTMTDLLTVKLAPH